MQLPSARNLVRLLAVLGLGGLPLLAVAASSPGAEQAPIVIVQAVKTAALGDTITYPARISSEVQAQVYAPSDGVVTRIVATLGTRVRKGARLLLIKNTDPAYEYVPVVVDAPVKGVVSAVAVTEGTRVTRGQALASLTDPERVSLRVEIPAADLTTLKPGASGTFTLPTLEKSFPPLAVKVRAVSPLVDPATGTATAELTCSGSLTCRLPLGAIGRATFLVNRHQGLQVPEQALVYRGKKTLLRLVDHGKARFVPVKVATTQQGLTEITAGLHSGDQVIVRTSGFVADGQPVVVQNGSVATK